MSSKILKLGLPKGSLQEATIRMLHKAGFNISVSERSYFPSIDDPQIECVMLRAQEMSRYVEQGALDCGITGNDWILENRSSVVRVADLMYAKQSMNKVRWVIAVPENSGIKSVKDLEGKHIATELVSATRDYLKKNKVNATVEFSWGATEAKVGTGLSDAIVELTETGRSLRAHKLRELATVCESTTQFIANNKAWKDAFKRAKMEQIVLLLKGALLAEEKVGIKMNVRKRDLNKLTKRLPALKKPTISMLSEAGWVAVEIICDERTIRTLIPELKKAGAQGIIEYPLNKVIY
ncbi:MAG: ATP phosphoribosyltransferase [Candidatus Omnitrophica bacterium]|nr:ATP phosphoribosyltransferase [Candidatus Omnitrophota bacterium]MDD5236691.1 ATP phosphoribosyltransferase [Candidatus Omnitrophota bacterium]MDD5610086.1 ATP phosphoribosyltransferase [Candidatus Omnitrophota bacterium]